MLDEVPMSSKHAIEAFDRMLCDINESDMLFGGKIVVFAGEFHQVLPIVRKGTIEQQIDVSLVSSHIWLTLAKIKLTENMHVRLDSDLCKVLPHLGTRMPPIIVDNRVKILDNMIVSYKNDSSSMDMLIESIFSYLNYPSQSTPQMLNQTIIAPKNAFMGEINSIPIEKFPDEIKQYYSFNQTIKAFEQGMMEAFLSILTPNGLPPHELLLKHNCPIMLSRNLDPSEGLCNGTHLICRAFDQNLIDTWISVGGIMLGKWSLYQEFHSKFQ